MNEQELSIPERHTPSQMQNVIYGAFLGNLWYMYQQVGRWVRMGKPGRASPEIWMRVILGYVTLISRNLIGPIWIIDQ